jgi:hypothetical protein
MREIPNDVFKEEIDDIKDMLFNFFVKDIRAILTRGVPEWYKNELLKKQFETEPETKPDTYREVDWT